MNRRWQPALVVLMRLTVAFAAVALIGVLARKTRSRPPKSSANVRPAALAGRTNFPVTSGVFLPLVCEPALGDLRFVDPVQAVPLPDGSGRLAVVERLGRVQLVDRNATPPRKTVLLDLRNRLQITPDQAEEGLLGLAFHPRFADPQSPHRNELFVYYSAQTKRGPTNRLSRFRVDSSSQSANPTIDLASEEVLIDQPDQRQAHNGGGLVFGPDGFLYLGVGDDALPQPNPNAQAITGGLFSGILRIDVDCQGGQVSRPAGGPYYIPLDNPFVGRPGAREEFFAIGLRNPWRFSFDSLTGRLFAADPGDRRREEINLVEAGSNCGWAYAEGTLLTAGFDEYALPRPANYLGRETWPIFEYQRDVAHRCVIGGHVYRGRQFPEYHGHYLFADQSGRIYALQLDFGGRKVLAQHLLAVIPDMVIGVSSVDRDVNQELLLCTIGDLGKETGQIYRLRRTEASEQAPVPPNLAETGLFADWQRLIPRDHLVRYDVNVPLWSDGADKQRWISVPPGESVEFASAGRFRYPSGTVFVKHFALCTDERQKDVLRPLETRVLVVDERQTVYGLTYRWSADGKRTRPVTRSERETIDIVQADGSVRKQVWHYPGRFDCLMCHNDSAGYVLGFVPKQLAGDQLPQLMSCGVVRDDGDGSMLAGVKPLVPLADESTPLQERIRSYLDVNCSTCHNPGRRFAAFDTRIEREFEEQGLVGGMAYHHSDLGAEVRIVKAGNLAQSMLYLRLTSSEPHQRMPPLGSTVVDEEAKQKFAQWIESLVPTAELARPPTTRRE